mmetsp:Transcript_5034/g.11327  ORF Transcript_5034/g.11327 Transcript_5034/m.11327 type:complete len:116 (+) Transcript_5034:49-396(+)
MTEQKPNRQVCPDDTIDLCGEGQDDCSHKSEQQLKHHTCPPQSITPSPPSYLCIAHRTARFCDAYTTYSLDLPPPNTPSDTPTRQLLSYTSHRPVPASRNAATGYYPRSEVQQRT